MCGSAASTSSSPPPSTSHKTVVLTIMASGDVSDYADTTSLRQKIADAAGVDASLVTISVTAASVLITATIVVPASTTPAAVQTSLASSLGTAENATAALGITVESDPSITASPPPGGDDGKGSSDDGANAGAVAGGVIGGIAFSMLVAGLVYLCRQKSKASNRSNANAQTAARAASATTGQGQQMSNVQPPVVVSGAVVMGQAQPSRGSLYPPTYAMGTPVV